MKPFSLEDKNIFQTEVNTTSDISFALKNTLECLYLYNNLTDTGKGKEN